MSRFLAALLAACLLAACTPASPQPTAIITPSATFLPAATGLPPTPAPPGSPVMYRGLQVACLQAELTQAFETEFGTTRQPTGASQFLWVQVRLQNGAGRLLSLPRADHFSALYLGRTEYKAIYGRRLGHPDYLTLAAPLAPEQALEAWLAFSVPAGTELGQFWFAYLPESIEISFTTADVPVAWAEHPLYLWNLTP